MTTLQDRVSRLTRRRPVLAQLARFALVGGLATLVNAAVYLTLRTWWDLLPANLAALLVSTLVSTEVNRRFTFGATLVHRWRAHAQTAGVVAFYAVYSSAVLLVLTAVIDNPTPLLEAATVAAASVLGGLGRFLLLRYWVFAPDPAATAYRPPRDPTGREWGVRSRWAVRVGLALLAGTALVLTAAGSCDTGSAPDTTQTGY